MYELYRYQNTRYNDKRIMRKCLTVPEFFPAHRHLEMQMKLLIGASRNCERTCNSNLSSGCFVMFKSLMDPTNCVL